MRPVDRLIHEAGPPTAIALKNGSSTLAATAGPHAPNKVIKPTTPDGVAMIASRAR
jgi:hypothetical protein